MQIVADVDSQSWEWIFSMNNLIGHIYFIVEGYRGHNLQPRPGEGRLQLPLRGSK